VGQEKEVIMSSPWPDVVHAVSTYYTDAWAAVTGGAVSNASGDVSQAANAAGSAASGGLAGFAGFTSIVEEVWAELKDWRMWASLGWLILGIGLMFAGVFLWMKSEGISSPVPIPVPV
jgi:hypothetical protein